MQDLQQIASQAPDLELLARQVVDGFIIGMHRSPFHGFSVEFAEHRLYNPGDNLRHVDWKVYGRTDKMFSKKYEEETNLRCCITIDTSGSMYYHPEERISKLEASVRAAVCLVELLRRQMDASSLALFDDNLYLLTGTGTSLAHRNTLFSHLQQVRTRQPDKQTHTQAAETLHELAERLHKRSLIILFSDMLDSAQDPEKLIEAIQHLKHNKHEVILFLVGDKKSEWDFELGNKPVQLRDMETGEEMQLHPEAIIQDYQAAWRGFAEMLKDACGRMNVDMYMYDIADDPAYMLRNYLMKRMKMM